MKLTSDRIEVSGAPERAGSFCGEGITAGLPAVPSIDSRVQQFRDAVALPSGTAAPMSSQRRAIRVPTSGLVR